MTVPTRRSGQGQMQPAQSRRQMEPDHAATHRDLQRSR